MHFVTSNSSKFQEAQLIIPTLRQKILDLPEIQELNSEKIIESKLNAARLSCDDVEGIVVEDVALCLDGLNGLPGPLVKWFLGAVGPSGLYQIAKNSKNTDASVSCNLGLSVAGKITFFKAEIRGILKEPVGENGFGFDVVFCPNGSTKTYAEMTPEEKQGFSMRAAVFSMLKTHLSA